MDVILGPLGWLIVNVIDLYTWILVIGVILSWLTAYNVVNTSNRLVYMIGDFIFRITEPALRPIRNLLPNLGGFDLSPVVLIFILIFAKGFLIKLLFKFG
ncbi:MAG TPA: YggT family protein [Alphaproteobacteria bacterium]|nr:YggT family protein [Alphaproteobacteria bacterium]